MQYEGLHRKFKEFVLQNSDVLIFCERIFIKPIDFFIFFLCKQLKLHMNTILKVTFFLSLTSYIHG